MSSLQIDVTCRVSPHEAMRLAIGALQRMGYELGATSDTEAQLLYRAGSATAGRLDEHRHRLKVSAAAGTLSFLYEAGLSHGGLVIAAEREELERRTNEVMKQISSGATLRGKPRQERCPVCATPAAPEATVCSMCGIPLDG